MTDWNVKEFYVYMMTNRSRIVLYTGVTNDLTRRVWEHKNHVVNGFTAKYKLDRPSLRRAVFRRDICENAEKGDQSLAARKEK
jgi:predicted GIY-YIG superfamily endonuclease